MDSLEDIIHQVAEDEEDKHQDPGSHETEAPPQGGEDAGLGDVVRLSGDQAK